MEVPHPTYHTFPPMHTLVSADSCLFLAGGVAGAISRAGGREVQVESDRWVRQHGEVATGEVAGTGPTHPPPQHACNSFPPLC